MELYLFLQEDSIPEPGELLERTWNQIIEDRNHHLIVNEVDDQIVSSCVCVIILVNGAWDDKTTEERKVTLSRYENEDLALVLKP